ncbi:hypothetical protein D9X30_1478 [Cupriavidus sp. U2]|uniref:DUF883 family protein n=1 Tax=Cupriavidus sp. U2 TaxID=2920269 RepID=UPI001892A438|nr:DUF883 family protein [Cupriavidus sp. U2]KAI3593751.1 hypothetical protein D9X30_1478 [Cupriavidus sp. U2]
MAAFDPNDTNVSSNQQKLQADTRQLAKDLDDLLAQLPNLTGEAIETAKQTFLAKAAQGTDKLASIKASVSDSVSRGQECVTDYTHREPIKALGMALGIGVLLGALLCRPTRHGERYDD